VARGWALAAALMLLTLPVATGAPASPASAAEDGLADGPAPLPDWQAVIRQSPYWMSQGVHANLTTIRRWVLAGESFCEDEDRHIFFDRRASFVGYISNVSDPAANQALIDDHRQHLAAAGRTEVWVRGGLGRIGYPFVLGCRQPYARLAEAMDRYTGADAGARLWGTWDGMRIGSPERTVSLHEAIAHVYAHRSSTGRITLPEHVLSTLAGKTIIESGGGVRDAHSPAGARGIMQLSPAALRDCGLEPRFHLHRIAQIDCALALLEQNHRNLAPVFETLFGHLPEDKGETLYGMLLLQAYHGGVGRVRALLTEDPFSGAARYFAEHHQRFTAGDIALGIVFHNLGRMQLGFASLYYVTDVGIATRAACARLADLPGCD
jgi:hypothetical protein